MEGTAYTRTLRRAAETAGGLEKFATLLHASAADMARWIAGESRPPQDIFLAALDIVSRARGVRRDEQFRGMTKGEQQPASSEHDSKGKSQSSE